MAASTSMEGVPVTVEEVHRILAGAAIHPFRDGNGRVARVVASLAMYRGGFKLPEFTSLEEWWGRHRTDYYRAFHCLGETFDRGADVTPFIRAHMEAQLHQVRALDLRERVQQRIWTAVEEAGSQSTAAGVARQAAPSSSRRTRSAGVFASNAYMHREVILLSIPPGRAWNRERVPY